MKRRRRTSQLEMNFDGLTDSVTNLVGTLVLLIVLLVGVTKQAVYTPPTVAAASAARQQYELQPLDSLLEQLESLRQHLRASDRTVTSLEADASRVQNELQQILNKPRDANNRGK